jgi:hypothetical protein
MKVWAAHHAALSFLPFCSTMELGQLIHDSKQWPFPQKLYTSGVSHALNLDARTIEGISRSGKPSLSIEAMEGRKSSWNMHME